MTFTSIILLAALTLWIYRRARQTLHLLQLDSYSNSRLLKWLFFDPWTRLLPRKLLAWAGLSVLLAVLTGGSGAAYLLSALGGFFLYFKDAPPEEKKPLVMTGRATRILLVSVALALLIFYLGLSVISPMVSGFAALLLVPMLVIGANLLLLPVQKFINFSYLWQASKRLSAIKPAIIGISGSFGKTSCKYFLDTILSERFAVLKTPGSFNTLLGVSRVINGELKPHHKIFIVEIGAYQRGDVLEKCEFVKPQIGLFSAIGPEHFERFKSMENIILTHKELVDSLPEDGVAVFNVENEFGLDLASRSQVKKSYRYGETERSRLWAEDVAVSPAGMNFTLKNVAGESIKCTCRLLGKHNITNILGAAIVAEELGLTFAEIERGIRKLEPAPHRLQLLARGDVTVIDDSYNSNPDGAKAALETLGEFQSGRKVLITPGMVELGVLEEEKNRELGERASKVCDYVILVGPKQTKPIAHGLLQAGFPESAVKVVKDLNEARVEMERYVKAGDVVLFENDLPDLYAE